MEISQLSLLDELIMAPNMDTSFPNEYFTWNFDQTHDMHLPATNLELISPPEYSYPCPFGEFQPFLDALTSPEFGSFYDLPSMAIQEEYAENREAAFVENCINSFEGGISIADDRTLNMENVNVGFYGERKNKSKKPDGQPSKNLMAERRRRKRLNDRLSMLRSIVPKISKMDRTSILGDTIDYMKELLDKIHKLREDGVDENMNQVNFFRSYLKELKPNEMQLRNPPKFDIERRNHDTRVEVCCTAKPGLLLSTLSTLDALGLEIQQCVISCFNDFSLQAACYEAPEQRVCVSSEDIKQELFRNAGYGGRCL